VPLAFDIIPVRGLVVVRYSGFATIEDTVAASRAYVAHPDYVAGQKQLIDLSAITDYEKDYVRFMEMQAQKVDRFAQTGMQTIVAFVAHTAISREVAMMFLRSWDDVETVVPVLQNNEAKALAILGQPEKTIRALLDTFVK